MSGIKLGRFRTPPPSPPLFSFLSSLSAPRLPPQLGRPQSAARIPPRARGADFFPRSGRAAIPLAPSPRVPCRPRRPRCCPPPPAARIPPCGGGEAGMAAAASEGGRGGGASQRPRHPASAAAAPPPPQPPPLPPRRGRARGGGGGWRRKRRRRDEPIRSVTARC